MKAIGGRRCPASKGFLTGSSPDSSSQKGKTELGLRKRLKVKDAVWFVFWEKLYIMVTTTEDNQDVLTSSIFVHLNNKLLGPQELTLDWKENNVTEFRITTIQTIFHFLSGIYNKIVLCK